MKRRRRRRGLSLPVVLVILALLAAAAIGLVIYLQGCGGLCNPVTPPQASDGDTQPSPGTQTNPQQPVIMTAVTGSVEDGGALDEAQRQLMQDLLNRWYMFIGSFTEQDLSDLFTDSAEADSHMAACRTLVAIRQRGLTDLHMTSVAYTLTVTDVTWRDSSHVRILADEDVTMRFAATPDVDSQVLALPHIYELEQAADGSWRMTHHEADDNPYFSFTKESDGTIGRTDARMQLMLADIAARQAERGGAAPVEPAVAHPYDREAALRYLYQYIDVRNGGYHAYDLEGGNCMNFGSQVLLAGGIPMESGTNGWYYYNSGDLALSWINVGYFYDYAKGNTGYGLVADTDANYYTGQVGDFLLLGVDGGHNHTTVITGLVKNDAGETVDYLISCNTTNCKDFPVSAYYYPSHDLIKIWGWND